jgi:hypothetical protein
MDISRRIGKILSIYLVVTGAGFLLSGDYYAKMIAHTGSDPVLINLSGMVHFFIGMTVLVSHFLWKKTLQLIVSVLGILFTLKGIALIALPEYTLHTADNAVQIPWIMALAFISLGSLIAWLAFFGNPRIIHLHDSE